jgi:hypothetical protein
MRYKHNGVDLLGHWGDLAPANLHRYNLTSQEITLIHAIVERLQAMLRAHDPMRTAVEFDGLTLAMDIATVHCNDRRINLSKLLASDATDFRMDLLALHVFTDRATGKLANDVTLKFQENKV